MSSNAVITQDAKNPSVDNTDPIEGKKIQVITNQIMRVSVDRTPKDILSWRDGLIYAESMFYPNRTKLYDVYADVILDGHLKGIINKRIDSVLNKTLMFIRADGEKEDKMDSVIKSDIFREIIRELMLQKMWGVSGMEFIPGEKITFNKLPRKHIKPKWKVITYTQYGIDGISYTDLKNIWVIGEPDELGLLLNCGYYALLKKGAISDWAQYIELFGQPVRLVKYDAYDQQTKIELKQVLEDSGSSLALMIPNQANFEMHDGKTSNGDGKLQDNFVERCNHEMDVVILGNTETSGSSKSSGYAQSETHANQQLEITKSDMVDICSLLNSEHFLNILKSYALPVDGGHFEYDKEVDITFLKEKIKIDVQAINAGLPVSLDYMYDTYSIPKPKEGDKLMIPLTIAPEIYDDEEQEDGDEPDSAANKKKAVPGNKAQKGNLKAMVKALTNFFAQAPRR